MNQNEKLEPPNPAETKTKHAASDGQAYMKPSRRQVIKSAIGGAVAVSAAGSKTFAESPIARETSDITKNVSKTRRSRPDPNAPLKLRAQRDYHHSLRAFGGRLSNPINNLIRCNEIPHFQVVVIGSGYGASISALRIAEKLAPQHRICILERGREWVPGTFPDTYSGINKESRARVSGKNRGQINNPLGLFNLSFSDEINTMSASGLGGTSLINANVALKTDSDVFRQSRWPLALSDRQVLDPYYEIAANQLNLQRSPYDQTSKIKVRREAAARISRRPGFFDRSPLAITYDHRYLDDRMQNQHGMIQRTCTLCGDCITGCNVGAKNHLLTNYLPMAKAHGVEMYTQVEVKSLQPCQAGYQLGLDYHDDCTGKLQTTKACITAEIVILGCGSPGSSHVLLQSQNENFQFSPSLGHNWTFNGDTIGFVMEGDFKAQIAGIGANEVGAIGPGPTLQTSMLYERRPELKDRIVIQEASLPTAVTGLFKFLVRDRQLDNSMVMLGMGHDEGTGQVIWRDNRWQIKWPGLKDSAYRKMMFNEFERVARSHGGWYKRLKAFGDNLVTVHPLGSCGMSDDPGHGVVNHLGQVYNWEYFSKDNGNCSPKSRNGQGIHPGLYVSDGSVFPTPVGINPFMTICAVSERIAQHIIENPAHAHLFANA